MDKKNITVTSWFVLRGFLLGYHYKIALFILFLFIYLLSISANILIIFLVQTERRLHKPMYFFLSNVSFLEIWYISSTVPKMLSDLLSFRQTISLVGCVMQFYFFFFFGSTENFLLVIMSFDRYIAICYPLRYRIIMNERLCRVLAAGAWIGSVFAMIIVIIPISRLSFCGQNEIDHVFCDFSPLVKLSCYGATLSEIVFYLSAGMVMIGCFTIIIISYGKILQAVLSTSLASGARTAYATCSSHLMVVLIYYGTVMFMYMRPAAAISFPADKIVSVVYSVLTPLLNPVIYSLRNKEVKEALKRTFHISMRGIMK